MPQGPRKGASSRAASARAGDKLATAEETSTSASPVRQATRRRSTRQTCRAGEGSGKRGCAKSSVRAGAGSTGVETACGPVGVLRPSQRLWRVLEEDFPGRDSLNREAGARAAERPGAGRLRRDERGAGRAPLGPRAPRVGRRGLAAVRSDGTVRRAAWSARAWRSAKSAKPDRRIDGHRAPEARPRAARRRTPRHM